MSDLPLLSVTEIIDIAKQLEAIGEAFYDEARRHARGHTSRKVLTWLRDEEHRHALLFERVLQGLAATGGEWRLDETYLRHLRTLAERKVFPSADEARAIARGLPDDRAVARQALAFEEASIAFFEALEERIRPADRPAIEQLVAEERRHVHALLQLLERLESGGE